MKNILSTSRLSLVFAMAALFLQPGCSPTSTPQPETTTPTLSPATPIATPTPVPLAKIPLPQKSDLVLSETERGVPGAEAADWLYYQASKAETVKISGAWGWLER